MQALCWPRGVHCQPLQLLFKRPVLPLIGRHHCLALLLFSFRFFGRSPRLAFDLLPRWYAETLSAEWVGRHCACLTRPSADFPKVVVPDAVLSTLSTREARDGGVIGITLEEAELCNHLLWQQKMIVW